jgi:uncharacterized protein
VTSSAGSIRILRAAARQPLSWKNCAGITRELAAYPPGSDLSRFDWRVSIAEIQSAAAFSSFPGIDRRMVVLSGRLSLSIAGGPAIECLPESPALEFAGESAVFAEPRGGPVTDLNVMTRRGRFTSRVTLARLSGARQLPPQPGTRLVLALANLTLGGTADHAQLAPLDALQIEADASAELQAGSAAAAIYLIEIIAAR